MRKFGKVAAVVALCGLGLWGITSCGPDNPEPEPRPGINDETTGDASGLWVFSEMKYEKDSGSETRIESYSFKYSNSPARIVEVNVDSKYSYEGPLISNTHNYTYSYHKLGIYCNDELEFSLDNGLFSYNSKHCFGGYTNYSADKYVENQHIDWGDDYYDDYSCSWKNGLLTKVTYLEATNVDYSETKFTIAYSSNNNINKGCYRMLNSFMLSTIFDGDYSVFGNPVVAFGGYYGQLPNQLISEVAYSYDYNNYDGSVPVLFEFSNIDNNGCPQTLKITYLDGDKDVISFKWEKL